VFQIHADCVISDLSVVVQNMYPKEPCWKYGPGQPGLFTLALTNSALFHMIMCSSAIYMDVYAGRQESREGQLHKLEAIQSLNDGMKDTSGTSDASIGAVAYLAKVEVSISCYSECFNLTLPVHTWKLRHVENPSGWHDKIDRAQRWDRTARSLTTRQSTNVCTKLL
jgi:hypothetical protein